MMTRLSLLLPLGLLFAWSAPWQCSTYASGDGGRVFPTSDGGGGAFAADASVTAVYDAGEPGLAPGPDGGVTVGQSANFKSNFVYMSNAGDGTISRLILPADGGAPYEEARYFSVVPVNNHGHEPLVAGQDIWVAAGCHQLEHNGGYRSSPSRTLVDRNGNVWVALRAPNCQAGVTRITNVDDHLSQCEMRCIQRQGLQPNQIFTEGVPLTQIDGGVITLSPTMLGVNDALHAVIAPSSAFAHAYACLDNGHDHTGNVMTDPVNFDDCLNYSIPLGYPNPDPEADATGLTANTAFGRAAAVSPACQANGDCDVWVGMWCGDMANEQSFNCWGGGVGPNGVGLGAWVRLGSNKATSHNPVSPLAFDVADVLPIGSQPYGATVDCAGLIWSSTVNTANLTATTTVPINDPTDNINIGAEQVLTNFDAGFGNQPLYGLIANGSTSVAVQGRNRGHPGGGRASGCTGYGISSDPKERIWVAGWTGGARACSFNAGQLLQNYEPYVNGTLTTSQFNSLLAAAWETYDMRDSFNSALSGLLGRGINVDRYNNVFMGLSGSYAAGVMFNPDVAPTSSAATAVCSSSAGCSDGNVNWTYRDNNFPPSIQGQGTIGVDIDADGNPWFGQHNNSGSALRIDQATGTPTSAVTIGSDTYSYSDFTGYALRYITLSTAEYTTAIPGCGVSPELTQWNQLSYQATIPNATDLSISVEVVNDPSQVGNATSYPVCPSYTQSPSHCGSGVPGTGSGTIDLSPFNLPSGRYLYVTVTLTPQICTANGGAAARAKPVLYKVTSTQTCPGD